MKYALYVVVAFLAIARMLVAAPLLFVEIGADIAGDEETRLRMERWVTRIAGA